jgi:hypothetical protein
MSRGAECATAAANIANVSTIATKSAVRFST